MKRFLIPFVVLSAFIAIGAGAWLAASTMLPSPTLPPTQTPTTPAASGVDTSLYLAVASTSDFTPPVGPSEGSEIPPWGKRRLMTATSTDGTHFTPTGKILTDRANVPDLVTDPDGTLRLYYIGQGIADGKSESTAMALSKDGGVTWEFRALTFADLKNPNHTPSDPDVVLLEDGSYRMFYTTSLDSERIGIAYADSTDGIAFTYQGIALSAPNTVVDSTTFYSQGIWHMLVLQDMKPGQLHATSTDGMNFTLVDTAAIPLDDPSYFLSNPLPAEDVSQLFGFSIPENTIRSFTRAADGTWDTGDVALAGNANALRGTTMIQDLGVARRSDGTYLMVYVAGFPNKK